MYIDNQIGLTIGKQYNNMSNWRATKKLISRFDKNILNSISVDYRKRVLKIFEPETKLPAQLATLLAIVNQRGITGTILYDQATDKKANRTV